jgi:hypothetical protein
MFVFVFFNIRLNFKYFRAQILWTPLKLSCEAVFKILAQLEFV